MIARVLRRGRPRTRVCTNFEVLGLFALLLLLTKALLKDELVLEDTSLAVEQLTVAHLVGDEEHQGALEVEQGHLNQQVRKVGLHLLPTVRLH